MTKIKNIISNFETDLKEIDKIILQFAAGKSPLIAEISNNLIASGGKRIRPILLIIAAKLCGSKQGDQHLNLAAAVELIHSATLLHDDVVDNSQIRRGKKTANAIWDNKASILVGDYLFSIAFQLMVKGNNLAILDLLAKASSTMADGEVMQLENSNDLELSLAKYFDIIFGKTAILFSAACEVGGLLNNVSNQKLEALRKFGENLGVIFQMVDDILDYSSKSQVLGKNIGNDFFEAKVTLPIILLYNKASNLEQNLIKKLFTNNLMSDVKSDQDLEQIMELINKYDIFLEIKNLIINKRQEAYDNLNIFDDNNFKDNLIEILDYSFERIS